MSMFEWLHIGKAQVGKTVDGAFPFTLHKFSASVNLASVGAAVSAEQDVTITGIKSGDIPICLDSAAGAATLAVVPERCGADNTLTVRCSNTTAGAIDLGALTMVVTVLRPYTLS